MTLDSGDYHNDQWRHLSTTMFTALDRTVTKMCLIMMMMNRRSQNFVFEQEEQKENEENSFEEWMGKRHTLALHWEYGDWPSDQIAQQHRRRGRGWRQQGAIANNAIERDARFATFPIGQAGVAWFDNWICLFDCSIYRNVHNRNRDAQSSRQSVSQSVGGNRIWFAPLLDKMVRKQNEWAKTSPAIVTQSERCTCRPSCPQDEHSGKWLNPSCLHWQANWTKLEWQCPDCYDWTSASCEDGAMVRSMYTQLTIAQSLCTINISHQSIDALDDQIPIEFETLFRWSQFSRLIGLTFEWNKAKRYRANQMIHLHITLRHLIILVCLFKRLIAIPTDP